MQDPRAPNFPGPAEGEPTWLHAPSNSNHATALNPILLMAAMHAAQSDRSSHKHADEVHPLSRVAPDSCCENQPNDTPVHRHNSYLHALLSNLVPGNTPL